MNATTDPTRLHALFDSQRQAFAAEPMPSLATRRQQLRVLARLLLAHREALARAVNDDFSVRSPTETLIAEILPGVRHARYTLGHLRRWMRAERRRVPWWLQPARARVVYQPLGVVGIMVPFNYPVKLAIEPLIAALAAGNRVLLKMSELTPRTAALMARMLGEGFMEDRVAVVTGDLELARAFAALPFDHLLFTGSAATGRQVMAAAAGNLTPVTLELGGKSPVLIDDSIPLTDFIDRLVFAKSLNAGQTCVAPDHVWLPRARVGAFIDAYKASFNRLYPTLDGNPDYTGLSDERCLRRLRDGLREAVAGGAVLHPMSDEIQAEGSLRMVPCLVTGVSDDMAIMREEVFGPVLPVIPYDDLDEALADIRRRPRPLALYLFSHDRTLRERLIAGTHAGSMAVNDAVLQAGIDDLPFGGIGPSGMGQYHGREGFLTMSKAKPVLIKGRLNPVRLVYPPHGRWPQRLILWWLTR